MFYTATRLTAPALAIGLWAWLADGTAIDPANLFLLFAGISGAVGLASVRRYWHVRNTSRSRRDSSLLF